MVVEMKYDNLLSEKNKELNIQPMKSDDCHWLFNFIFILSIQVT